LTEHETPRLLTPSDAARYLGLGSRWALYRLIQSGDLPRLLIASKLRIDRKDLDALIERKKAGGVGAVQLRHATAAFIAVPRELARLMRRPRVTVAVPGDSRRAAMRASTDEHVRKEIPRVARRIRTPVRVSSESST
jgi:excisionase family DNA binding protein